VGRLLITLFLIERGRLSKPLLYLSSTIEQNRGDYYRLLQRIRTHGEWTEWLHYFLAAVRDTSRTAISQSQAIVSLREEYRSRLATSHRLLTLIDELFMNPYIDIARAAKCLGVSSPTATKDIKALENEGLLKEISGKDWGRIWLAEPILAAVRG
jgi:Fic family protein